ncbi:FeoA family protein [Candidatus Accumulibacter vicinus]|uniref:FeoA domain protein n=1 Tax=Candidatus Accumulibacter vicinus TaxID=2954382 RepID=A0A084Y431_9PROT|nr:FeoA family protein [Candidatus Accumulibacter vicinus]KFB69475.1 MAG: FeoA domain protein [Candidatus Accumulibacter vicinus]
MKKDTGSMNPQELIPLFDLPLGQEGIVSSRPNAISGDAADVALALRLFEIGFFDGERVRVVARGHPGGDPVAVRVGNTMFALRKFEAERVLVAPLGGKKT